MRELTSHKVNGLNEAIDITVLDEPGVGGANHVYSVSAIDNKHFEPDGTLDIEKTANDRHGFTVRFQNGPIKEAGVNGVSNEALLAIVEDRLRGFQSGPYACFANEASLICVQIALGWLKNRTQERVERGVEGTMEK